MSANRRWPAGPLAATTRRALLSLGLLLLTSGVARAGGGPHNVMLVVNQRSWASLAIANHYIHARQIPAMQVLYLDWPHSAVQAADIDLFRDQILLPVNKAIETRGLINQIDFIAYSADFPFSINAAKDVGADLGQGFAPTGSLNSLTFLYPLVANKAGVKLKASATPKPEKPADVNPYYSGHLVGDQVPKSRAFHLLPGYQVPGVDGTMLYRLSTMLAVTSGRGTSVSEAIRYLTASVKADGTSPTKTIYFSRTEDVRTKIRESEFVPAIAALKTLGVTGEIITTPIPQKKTDVLGLVAGTPVFDWEKSGSTIVPGALCDNLTSTAGNLIDAGGQTAMTQFLAHGAAGASGSVVEPLGLPQKFPSCALQIHYVRGCSLAESFYQSVYWPYQLLIIGDPLCQPWASPPNVTVLGVEPNSTVSETVKIEPSGTAPSGEAVARFELLIDGRRGVAAPPGHPLSLDTQNLIDGYHELTVVAVDGTAIEVQGRRTTPFRASNHQQSVTLTVAGPAKLKYGQKLKLAIKAEGDGAGQVAVFQMSRAIIRKDTTSAEVEIDSRVLGLGPTRLQAASLDKAGKPLAVSDPIEIAVEYPDAIAAIKPPAGKPLVPGIELTLANGRKIAVKETGLWDWLDRAGVKPNDKFSVTGYFEAPEQDIYQLAISYLGGLSIKVDGHAVYQGNVPVQSPVPWQYIPFHLGRGLHRIDITNESVKFLSLDMRFGGPGTWQVGARQFKHAG